MIIENPKAPNNSMISPAQTAPIQPVQENQTDQQPQKIVLMPMLPPLTPNPQTETQDPYQAQLQQYNQTALSQSALPFIQNNMGLRPTQPAGILRSIYCYINQSPVSSSQKIMQWGKISALDNMAESIENYISISQNPNSLENMFMIRSFLRCLHKDLGEIIGTTPYLPQMNNTSPMMPIKHFENQSQPSPVLPISVQEQWKGPKALPFNQPMPVEQKTNQQNQQANLVKTPAAEESKQPLTINISLPIQTTNQESDQPKKESRRTKKTQTTEDQSQKVRWKHRKRRRRKIIEYPLLEKQNNQNQIQLTTDQ